MSNIKLKDGQRLSAYGFGCGYIERVEIGSLSVQIWHECIYHIRCHCNYDGRIFWLSMRSLGQARKIYRKASKLVLANNVDGLRQLANEYKQYN